MKRTNFLLTTIAISGFITLNSCQNIESTENTPSGIEQYFIDEELSKNYDAQFNVKFVTGLNSHDSIIRSRSADATAWFQNNGSNTEAGDVRISDYLLNFNPRNRNYQSNFRYDFVNDVFGNSNTYSIEGNENLPAFSHTTYFPNVINATSPNIDEMSYVEYDSDIEINWNQDPGNEEVFIAMHYNGPFNKSIDENLPDESFFKYYKVADNGSFTIPASEIKQFPKGGHGTLYVARGHLEEKNIGEEFKAGFVAITKSNSNFIIKDDLTRSELEN